MTWTRPHLLDIETLSEAEVRTLLARARAFLPLEGHRRSLEGRLVANLFFEASTRTRASFEIAAEHLGARVLNLDVGNSSTTKGESLVDTVQNIEAMGVSAFVLRHFESGAPHLVAKKTRASIVNAGDGRHEHPTQALLDALTILEAKGRIEGLEIVIAGDVAHSRVARSNIHLIGKLGGRVRLAAPLTLMPRSVEAMGDHVTSFQTLDDALDGADVVMMLRVQTERIDEAMFPSKADYHRAFGLTEARFSKAKRGAIIMHPGPMNRGVEIAGSVADRPDSVILAQVRTGVAVRMAVLELTMLREAA